MTANKWTSIEKRIELLNEELEGVVQAKYGKQAKILSNQIITVSKPGGDKILRFTNSFNLKAYQKAEVNFTSPVNGRPTKTLLFAETDDYFTYAVLNSNTAPDHVVREWNEVESISIQEIKKLSDQNHFVADKLWCELVLSLEEFYYGGSIIWVSHKVNFFDYSQPFFTSAFIVFNQNIDTELQQLVSRSLREFLVNLIVNLHETELRKQTIRTAFAELNVRTLSHNIGSHILAYELEKEKSNFVNSPIDRDEDFSRNDRNSFHNYLRQRMLYNSDIVSGKPSYYVKYRLKNILESFEDFKIVTERISGYRDKKFDGFEVIGDLKNKLISVPSGIVGLHGFYVIWENLIRNYFKHGGKSNKIALEVSKHSEDKNHYILKIDYYRIEELDEDDNEMTFDIDEGYVTYDIKTYNAIFEYLHQSILNEEFGLRNNGRGILEMRGASLYLNGISLEHIDEVHDTLQVQYDNRRSIISYLLKVKKPRLIGIILAKRNETLIPIEGIEIFVDVDEMDLREFEYLIFQNTDLIQNIKTYSSITRKIFQSSKPDHKQYPFFDLNKIFEFNNVLDLSSQLNGIWVSQYFVTRLNKEMRDMSIYLIRDNLAIDEISKNNIQIPSTCQILEESELFRLTYLSIDEKKASIVIDQHGKIFKNKNLKNKFFHYEPYRSESSLGRIINESSNFSIELFDSLIFSATQRILIIDERIQNNLNRNITIGESEMEVWEAIEKCKILIPHRINDIDLNVCKFESEETKKDYESTVVNFINRQQCDILIIHLGLIERFIIANKTKETIGDWLKDKIKNLNEKEIIITSERGGAKTVPEFCRYVDYSNISKYVIEDQSKYHLVDVLLNSRNKENHYGKTSNHIY